MLLELVTQPIYSLWSQRHMWSPCIIRIILEHHLVLHVTAVDTVVFWIISDWHLENKCLIWGSCSSSELVGVNVEQERVFEETTTEASEDENVGLIFLINSTSLSIWKHLGVHINHFPVCLFLMIVKLNWVNVFSGFVGDTAEDVDKSVHELARAVIMSSNIKVWHLKPKINICVVHLTLHFWRVFLFSTSSDHNEFLTKPGAWMSVSWMLHWVSLDKSEAIFGLNLVHVVESVLILLIVTSTDHEKLTKWSIDKLEIMWESNWGLCLEDFAGLFNDVYLDYIFAVFLKDMQKLEWWKLWHETIAGVHGLGDVLNWLCELGKVGGHWFGWHHRLT